MEKQIDIDGGKIVIVGGKASTNQTTDSEVFSGLDLSYSEQVKCTTDGKYKSPLDVAHKIYIGFNKGIVYFVSRRRRATLRDELWHKQQRPSAVF